MVEKMIKQIACGRRKPNMTRKEYNDHRFQVHGRIAEGPSPDCSPHKYIQTPIFDSAFGARAGGLNLNHSWVGRDDVTELYFRDLDHLKMCFGSDYVKTTVGPDAPLFADLESTMVLMAREHLVNFPTTVQVEATALDGHATVAIYFLSTKDNHRDGTDLRGKVEGQLLQCLRDNAADQIYNVEVNVGFVSKEFDFNVFFGGSHMPQYALVYKLFLKNTLSVPYVRKAQKKFENAVEDAVDFSTSFIVFGNEALVVDYEKNIMFDPKRQPVFDEAEYAQSKSHLE